MKFGMFKKAVVRVAFIVGICISLNPIFGQTDSSSIVRSFEAVLKNPDIFDSVRISQRKLVAKQRNEFLLIDTYWFNVAKTYLLRGELSNAFSSVDSGLNVCEINENRYKKAKYLNLKGSIYTYQNKYEDAIALFQESLQILEEYNDHHSAALIKNNVANLFFSLSDYNAAYNYSLESFVQLNGENDTLFLPPIIGILAISSLKLGKYDEGKQLALKCVEMSERSNNLLGKIIGYHSMGELYAHTEEYLVAKMYFEKSLVLTEKFQQWNFFMLNKVALQHTDLKLINYESSLKHGLQALELSEKLSNKNPITTIHKNLAFAYAGIGKFKEAFKNMQLSYEYYIRSAGVENQRIINDILIKYDTEKKENELIKNRLELVQKDTKLMQRNAFIAFLALIISLLALVYYFFVRNQKLKIKRIKREQETKRLIASIQAEERERERISEDLHDGVASSLTAIKFKLEEAITEYPSNYLVNIVAQLGSLHEEIRRISHNLLPLAVDNINWVDRIASYCRENSSSKLKIHFKNNLNFTLNLEPIVATLIYRSVQELIHNVQKHSGSSVCFVQLVMHANELIVSVEDEGKGFDINQTLFSQGHASIQKRLKELDGYLLIETKPGNGCLVSIHLTVNHENNSSR